MTAVIIEDEPLASLELCKVLGDVAPEIKVITCLETVSESIEWLRENKVDLIFSDIHLGDGQSFNIFRQVDVEAPVVFVTAYDEYALEAFKNQGIAYILKPYDTEEIKNTIQKVEQWWGTGIETSKNSQGGYQERFLVQLGARIKSVPVAEVAYFMADGKYLMLYTFDGMGYVVDQTVARIEERLDPHIFFRINRKFIINFSAIRDMIRYSNSRIKIILHPIPPENIESIVSTERLKEFKEWLNR